jgi:hypothetical protein
MEEIKNNQGSGLAIGALITGIIAFLMAVIPCIGIIAVVPGVIAVVLGIVGLSRESNSRGMLVGGLVIGIIALMLSLSQGYVVSRFAHHSGSWSKDIEKAMNDIKAEIGDDIDGKEFSIKVSDSKDTIEIKSTATGHDLEKKLDELEGDTITTVIIKK